MPIDRTLAVVGAGNMGSGIAQKMATEGFRVILVDLDEAALERGLANIRRTLGEAVERKIMKAEQVDAALARVEGTTDWSRLREVELVVEAVFENLEVKKDVFRRLSENTNPDTILGTNTSSFYVRDLLGVVKHPERVLGLHYFYHPAKNRLVEVVPTEQTDENHLRRAWMIQEAMGKTPIRCADAPGFVVNRYFVPWLNESVRLLEEGMGDIPTIEAAAKKAFRIGMGPFELMNVTGVPIALHAATTLGEQLGDFYAPAEGLKQQVAKKENWSLDGEADPSKFAAIEERLLGVVFLVAGELVDEQVGTIEDTDIGARVGLRWSLGPFELMNRIGVAGAKTMAEGLAKRWGRTIPKVLANQATTGHPYVFRLVDVERDGDIATLSINRPDAMNAINQEVVRQLTERFDELDADDSLSAIVIAGRGKGFIAGADIRFFVKNIEKGDIDAIQSFTEKGHALLQRFADSKKTVIARVDGLSLGGGSELAMACDRIVATDRGSFGFPETGIGIYPGLGGTQRLSRRVGVPLARWLVLTGQNLDARTAAAIGLVDELTSHEDLPAAIRRAADAGKRNPEALGAPVNAPGFEGLVGLFDSSSLDDLRALKPESQDDPACARAIKTLGFKAPIALELADELIREGATGPLHEGLAAELSHLQKIFRTKDAYEGLSTLGKRRPQFQGH
ncbi:MAG: enoyl-CoA hydratase/isomerase family protein [Planctomycetes bacterium]|nr:enoyl-CoA hydratase/isomerase family protein [Planctomycetota bacterium]